MKRRTSIKLLALGGVAAAGGHYWLNKPRDHVNLGIDATLERLDQIDASALQLSGVWNASRTFNHLAQSIEFSMTGFPEMKSPIFRNTVGPLAFAVFQARGEMSHNLAEPIPGEDIQTTSTDSAASLQRLKMALQTFDAYTQPLQPHFAYGSLQKGEYAIAHVMHINNHLEELV